MHSSTLVSLVLVAVGPMALAQRSSGTSSVTSATSMKLMPTASRGAVTMEWNSKPVAAVASPSPTGTRTSGGMEIDMTMSDGMVMSSGMRMSKSGRMGPSATGSAMAGMTMSRGSGSLKTTQGFFCGGAVLVTLGAGVWLLG